MGRPLCPSFRLGLVAAIGWVVAPSRWRAAYTHSGGVVATPLHSPLYPAARGAQLSWARAPPVPAILLLSGRLALTFGEVDLGRTRHGRLGYLASFWNCIYGVRNKEDFTGQMPIMQGERQANFACQWLCFAELSGCRCSKLEAKPSHRACDSGGVVSFLP